MSMKQIEERRNRILAAWYDAGSDYFAATLHRSSQCSNPTCRGECVAYAEKVRREAWDIRHAPVFSPGAPGLGENGERRA